MGVGNFLTNYLQLGLLHIHLALVMPAPHPSLQINRHVGFRWNFHLHGYYHLIQNNFPFPLEMRTMKSAVRMRI